MVKAALGCRSFPVGVCVPTLEHLDDAPGWPDPGRDGIAIGAVREAVEREEEHEGAVTFGVEDLSRSARYVAWPTWSRTYTAFNQAGMG